jgi:hypothetical protein
MRLASVLLLLLLGTKTYNGPLAGGVENGAFSFTHTSDWTSNQIVNTVQNNNSNGLVVSWPKGGITAPSERPIPRGKFDINRSGCPGDQLEKDLSAQLYYGLSTTPKSAGVYRIAQSRKAEVVESSIVASTAGDPIQLNVSSEASSEYVAYTFQSKGLYLAFPMKESAFKYFNEAGMQASCCAFRSFKFSGLPLLSKEIADLGDYALFKPARPKSIVKIPANSFELRRVLVFLSDTKFGLLASGFVSLHLPVQ